MPKEEKLVMSFEPATIEHLGVKMYTNLSPALAEMIANSYDACAGNVSIRIYDSDPDDKKIIIEDDGIGMSFEEVNQYFLRIGRNRRKEGLKETQCDRIATGKKGLGKLALFGIGNRIVIETVQNKKGIKFILDWDEILNCKETEYSPKYELFKSKKKTGTVIILESLKRKTPYTIEALALSISRLFNFPDHRFKLTISLNDSAPINIDNKLKYGNIEAEFIWDYKKFLKQIELDYEYKKQIEGVVITTEKPLRPGLRGITLFSNGRLINSPEFFGQSESSHFFSYTTGWLDVDFVDNWDEDLISTNRQSINWDNEKTILLRNFLRESLNFLEREWREKRKEKRKKNIQAKTKVNIIEWFNTLPKDVQKSVEKLVETIDDSELTEQNQVSAIKNIHDLIPEYPYYHWRHLNDEIQDASKRDYIKEDYYRAFLEAAKRYINKTRDRSSSTQTSESGMMGEVFGDNKALSVTKKYKKQNGNEFTESTKKNIEEGQKLLSMGIVQGGRNPVSHEEIKELKESDLFSEKDCLDGLSLLSHLMKRLENAEDR